MVSILELARCSNAVYSNIPEVEGWERRQVFNSADSGFFATLFMRRSGAVPEAIFAIRGTDDPTHDVLSDAQIAFGVLPHQSEQVRKALGQALKLAKISPDHFFLTGHSLGGGLAALKSARHTPHLPVVTFNAPGMFRAAIVAAHGTPVVVLTHGSLRQYRTSFRKALHIRSGHDLVSLGQRIMGKVATLPNAQCNRGSPTFTNPALIARRAAARALCAHRMGGLLELIKGQPAMGEPIQWG